MEKHLSKTFGILKELPQHIKELGQEGEGFWLWATREIIDQDGDLVVCSGINLKPYHDPDNGSRLKVLASHLRVLQDGTVPVIGTVHATAMMDSDYNGQKVPGLALYCKWLRDAQGELLPLAAHYKAMVDSGGVDSCSIGFIAEDYEPMEGAGLKITKSTIFEVSLCSVPANPSANLIKQLEGMGYRVEPPADLGVTLPADIKSIEGKDVIIQAEEPEVPEEPEEPEMPCDDEEKVYQKLQEGIENLKQQCTCLEEAMERLLSFTASQEQASEDIRTRLDVMESALVVLAHPAAHGENNAQKDENTKALLATKDRLDNLLKRFNP